VSERVKVLLRDDRGNTETLWAEHLGQDRYRLDNTPWYAYGISCGDVVEARPSVLDGSLECLRVVEKSGSRTVRLVLKPPADKASQSQAVLDRLRDLGCAYEGANPAFVAIDIPPQVDLEVIRRFLISTGQQWEHADPSYEDLFPESHDGGPAV